MAARGWATSILTALGVAAGAGAAQLGLGYGLGIVAWLPAGAGQAEAAWLASLTWVLWLAATATVLGAICADRLSARDESTSEGGALAGVLDLAWRVVIALAAAIGALITVPLVAIPARAAQRADTFVPQITAGANAVVGVVIGVLLAIAALSARAIMVNIVASVGWLWALAAIAIADGFNDGVDQPVAYLGLWRFSQWGVWQGRGLYLPGALLMLLAAFAIGALVAFPASRRGESRLGVALSGAIGPLLVAGAYLLAGTRLGGAPNDQQTASLMAPWAVLAGLGGSVLVATLAPQTTREARTARVEAKQAKAAKAAEDPVLDEWTKALSAVEAREQAAAKTDSREDELDEDTYAPPRAYRSEPNEPDPKTLAYVSDADDATAESTTATATVTPPATGRASVPPVPLWPANETPPPAPEEKKKRFGRKG
jgi:hypothetical protein